MKKYICDKCGNKIEETRIDNLVVKLSTTVVEHYQRAEINEYHFHNECWEDIKRFFDNGKI